LPKGNAHRPVMIAASLAERGAPATLAPMEQSLPPGSPAWRCCWPTCDATTISISCPLNSGQPWLAGRALDILRQEAEVEVDPGAERYATGRRQGAPFMLGEPLLWNGVPLIVEAVEPLGGPLGELTLRLPPWSEMAARLPEDRIWDATDRLAREFSSSCGVISDGRAIGFPDLRDPRRIAPRLQLLHLGVLVPAGWIRFLHRGSTVYRELPLSRLVVVLE